MDLLRLFALCLAFPASAGADGGDALFDLSLEELMQVEVRTVSRRAERLELAPASVTVFSREDLRRLGLRWLDELAPYVPGMQAYRRTGNSNWFYTPRLRGSPSDNGNEILILEDGQPRNTPFNGNAATVAPRLSLGPYARVEIIRGPGSAMYGGNAAYGVINLITGEEADSLELGVGEFAARQGRLAGRAVPEPPVRPGRSLRARLRRLRPAGRNGGPAARRQPAPGPEPGTMAALRARPAFPAR